jgi:diguanylate cyclase (GGDEF)-like protein
VSQRHGLRVSWPILPQSVTLGGTVGVVPVPWSSDAPVLPAPRRPDARGVGELTAVAAWDLDLRTGAMTWSEGTYRLAGLGPGAVRPDLDLWTSLVHPVDRPRFRAGWLLARESCRGYQEQYRIVGRDGVERHLHTWTEVQADEDGAAVRMFGAAVDIGGLSPQPARDPLTGLARRPALEAAAASAAPGAAPDQQVALLLVDLDRFGAVNATLGRRAGDAALVALAARLRRVLPQGGVLARLEGASFGLLLEGLPGAGSAAAAAEAVLAAVRAPLSLEGAAGPVAITAVVGLAVTDGSGAEDGEDLLRHAELALQRGRARGGDRCEVFRPELREQAEARLRSEAVLRSALAAQRVQVVYQPVVDLAGGDVVGVEALCRVVDPELGPLSPALFMDVAEETGLVVDLDEQVLRTATASAARWDLPVPTPISVAVNMSPRTLARTDLAELVAAALDEAGTPGHRLLVEITEHSLVGPGGAVSGTLRSLDRLAVRVGVDDFGTGWSALSYLSGLELGFVKVDRAFVSRLGQDAAAAAVVQAVIDLGHAHRLTVVAEGVETQEQAEALAAMGCDHGQGWWFGRPVPETGLPGAVAAWHERAAEAGFGAHARRRARSGERAGEPRRAGERRLTLLA